MTDPNSMDNWQLENDGKNQEQWQLQEAEQGALDRWQLQQTEGSDQWQPVDYVREEGGRNWILPAIITLALIGVVGYMLYIGLERFLPAGIGGTADDAATTTLTGDATPQVADSAAAGVTPSPVATDTPVPPTPVPPTPIPPTPIAPTPIPMVEQQIATVKNQYGVNARRAASADAELVRIMEDGETAFVFDQLGTGSEAWLQVFLTKSDLLSGAPLDGELVWVTAEFVELSTELVPPDVVAGVREFLGIALPEVAEAASAPAEGASAAEGAPSGGVSVTATISSTDGLNARSQPSTEAEIVGLLANDATHTIVSRSADNLWLQLALDDGSQVWVSAAFLTVNGDLGSVPVPGTDAVAAVDAGTAVTGTADLTATVSLTSSTGLTGTAAVSDSGAQTETTPAAPVADESLPQVSIETVEGVNARFGPSTDDTVVQILAQGTVLTATGRSTDTEWIRVQLEDGTQVWVFKSAVTTTPAVDDLPAVEPGAEASTIDATGAVSPTTTVTGTAALTVTASTTSTAPVEIVGPFVTITQLLAQVHSAPDLASPGIAVVTAGQNLPALGASADRQWIQIALNDNRIGWIAANLAKLSVDPQTLRVAE